MMSLKLLFGCLVIIIHSAQSLPTGHRNMTTVTSASTSIDTAARSSIDTSASPNNSTELDHLSDHHEMTTVHSHSDGNIGHNITLVENKNNSVNSGKNINDSPGQEDHGSHEVHSGQDDRDDHKSHGSHEGHDTHVTEDEVQKGDEVHEKSDAHEVHDGHENHDSHENRDSHKEHGMMMKMYFHISNAVIILFKKWESKSAQGMVGSCLAVALAAALYEGFKVARELLSDRCQRKSHGGAKNRNSYELKSTSASELTTNSVQSNRVPVLSSMHVLQTFLHFIQVVVSYSLMLVFMTYNVWLCLAVSVGSAVGYFCFAWLRTGRIGNRNECCH